MCGGMRDVWRCESIWSRGLGACTLGICSLLHVEVLSEELMNGDDTEIILPCTLEVSQYTWLVHPEVILDS